MLSWETLKEPIALSGQDYASASSRASHKIWRFLRNCLRRPTSAIWCGHLAFLRPKLALLWLAFASMQRHNGPTAQIILVAPAVIGSNSDLLVKVAAQALILVCE